VLISRHKSSDILPSLPARPQLPFQLLVDRDTYMWKTHLQLLLRCVTAEQTKDQTGNFQSSSPALYLLHQSNSCSSAFDELMQLSLSSFNGTELTHLQSAPVFSLHCSLQQLSVLPAPTSHSSLISTNELPQKLPDGAARNKAMTMDNDIINVKWKGTEFLNSNM